jgi:hypothetical protein
MTQLRYLWWVCAAGVILAGDAGIRPRPSASDYPAHQTSDGIEYGAAFIPADQVARLFATDLNKAGYLVIEVAVYPEPGNEANLLARDFLLRIGSDPSTIRPVSADTIAGVVQKQNIPRVPGPHDVSVYTASTVGYESGGRRNGGVLYTGAAVGVGVGEPPGAPPPPPATNPADRDVVRQELSERALPEGRTTDPVAGYLYFPKRASAKAKGETLHLTYYGVSKEIRLDLPTPKK